MPDKLNLNGRYKLDIRRLEALSFEKFTPFYQDIVERIIEDPMKNFVEAKLFMNFKPSPGQRVILKVIFQQELNSKIKYAIPIVDVEMLESEKFKLMHRKMTEVELYKELTGFRYNPSKATKQVVNRINLICGRRSGKTTLAAILALFCAITTNWKPFLHKTPFATVLVMSHSKDFSIEVLDIIKYFISESPVLSKLMSEDRKQTSNTVNLRMPFEVLDQTEPDISQVQIKVGAASSKTTRGIAACAVICDEIAFWNLDDTLQETDSKILKAVRPALTQFGNKAFMFKLSSPGIKQGVLYHEFLDYKLGRLPKSYEVFKAPTWFMNPAIPESELAEEYMLDQESFEVEYGSEFSDSLSAFIMATALEASVATGVTIRPPDPDVEIKFHAALDAAFKKDAFTFTIVAISEEKVVQVLSMTWQGSRKNPVKAQEVATWIEEAAKTYPFDFIGADQFAFQPLKEIFAMHNLVLQEYIFSTTLKKKIYFNLKKLIHSSQIDLLDLPLQTRELRELVVEIAPSGAIKIGHPKGGSDDTADCLAMATYIATLEQGNGVFDLEVEDEDRPEFNIKTTKEGIAFSAPSATMLMNSGHLGDEVYDNSLEFGIDPEDLKLKKRDNFINTKEEEEDIFQVSF